MSRILSLVKAIMKFLPYEKLIIHTHLDTEEVLKRLYASIEPRPIFFEGFWGKHKPYVGEINGHEFNTPDDIFYRGSSFIQGKVIPTSSGSSIRITMRPPIWIIIFMSLCLGYLILMFSIILASSVISFVKSASIQPATLPMLGAIGLFFCCVYGIFWGPFKFESVRSKKFFRKLFEAHSVTEF